MALVTGDDYEDLVEWVEAIAHDAAANLLRVYMGMDDDVRSLCREIGHDAAAAFTDLLANRYGED